MFYSTNSRIIGANLPCSLSLGTGKVTAKRLRMRINGKRYAIIFCSASVFMHIKVMGSKYRVLVKMPIFWEKSTGMDLSWYIEHRLLRRKRRRKSVQHDAQKVENK